MTLRFPLSMAVVCVALLAAGSVVASCSDSGQQSTGHFSATVREVGGIPPGLNRLVPGKVTLTDKSGKVRSAASESGRISIELAAGTYQAVATSPLINSGTSPCDGPATVIVRSSKTIHASFVCNIF
jgi:hypothetical protein